jgi:hypothetical protein
MDLVFPNLLFTAAERAGPVGLQWSKPFIRGPSSSPRLEGACPTSEGRSTLGGGGVWSMAALEIGAAARQVWGCAPHIWAGFEVSSGPCGRGGRDRPRFVWGGCREGGPGGLGESGAGGEGPCRDPSRRKQLGSPSGVGKSGRSPP